MLSDLLHRLRSLFRRDIVELELDEEMRFHLEQQVDGYMREGLDRRQALRRARLEFGGLDAIKEAHRDARGVSLIGQLAPGVSLKSAIAEANTMGAAIRPPWPADADPLTVPRFEVERLKDRTVERVRPALQVFLVAVVVVLLIVCANVANLLLARGTVRRREIAMRLSIGATRARVVRQILTESLVLALAGGAIGALLGAAGVSLIKNMATVEAPGIYRLMFGATILPRAHEITVDLRMLGIAFGLATITSVVFGLLPALTLARANHGAATGSRGRGTGRGESRIRAALVVGQLVMATVLLVSAGLLAHSFLRLSNVNNGYDPSNVVTFNLLLPDQYSITRKAETVDRLLTRLRALPNVSTAGSSRHGVLIGEEIVNSVDANVGIDALVPMRRLATSAVAPQRFYAVILGLFAAVAAILAALGIYGLLTHAVIQRTQEIGIRMAIGAQRTEVLALVLRRGLTLTAVGIALGLIASALSTRVLQGLLFGVTPLDPRTFLFVSLLFGLVASFASYLPARRATRVDALIALRTE
jgi:ABC-type antimicrobial peptide transport system permease subunit